MPAVELHWVAIALATIANMVIGSYWYSKKGFGREWSKLTGINMEDMGKRGANVGYAFTALAALAQAWILAHFVAYAHSTTLVKGAITGFWLWLGFIGITMAVNSMFSGQDNKHKFGLFRINAGYWIVTLMINGAILGAWS